MKQGYTKVAACALCAAMGLSMVACGGGGRETSSSDGFSDSDSGSGAEMIVPDKDVKQINVNVFADPYMSDLPMVQMHSPTSGLIDDVMRRGYGGVVMNVSWSSDYLNNVRAWASFADNVSYALDKGMYVWIYDEYGYPSGSAFGNTLKGHPEYEAQGLVSTYTAVAAGKSSTASLLHGHDRIVAAFVYDGKDKDSIDLTSGVDVSNRISSDGDSVSYTNNSASPKVLVSYMSKPWYENTHSMENWYAQQRYINMLIPEPAERFIEITHEKYYEYVGEHFGKGIKAFFTDEPAMQGNYFNISERQRIVIDKPDPDVPIVECLNYSDRLFDDFRSAYGYDLKDNLGYLYRDDGSAFAKQVRMDFYGLTSELFRKNYFGATADWCDAHGVKSSGHLLLEETLYQNPWFEGNMLQLLGTMGIPGSDLLYSTARRAAQDSCIVSKMASSAADFNGKKDTFAEISGAFDGTAGDMYSQLNAVGVQVAMGINNFSSYYYQGNNHTLEEDKIFSKAIGRMRYMVTGSEHRSKVAVYYPYEGVSAETLPTLNMWTATEGATEISNSFSDVCRALISKQVDYVLADYINLSKCTVESGALLTPNGERVESIVIPYTTALRSEAVNKLIEALDAGVEVILVGGTERIVCERGHNEDAKKFSSVVSRAKTAASGASAANSLRSGGKTYAYLDDAHASDIYVTKRENANYSVFTVVNAYTENRSYGFTLEAKGSSAYYYDAVSGDISKINAVFKGGKVTFDLTLPANRTGFILVK